MSLVDTRIRIYLLSACLLLCHPAWAEDKSRVDLGDVLYKGVAGKVLDAVPMDPEQRQQLQRANAVVSNTLTGRSLTLWAGISNPILIIGGLVYGIFSASRIKAQVASAPAESALALLPVPVEIAPVPQPERSE